ncbi:(d)CMP kinase [Staphylothermus hellenicus]|uniref:Cytidylate kinase n=1 Tax=Staphylothermus hellenicus (strain DSM 12710 / JCM 10830 / BK20S6-10-b1 / P8) TaxID=591019 RepID=D7D9R0_STAHD|nr:AAA family ATPase [Staphylothermus hellenicus]ADI32506.1 cytidylate kinase [Staphylothermus hellenicus DSM 12710]
MVVIVISGPPGGGKTTQARRVAEYFSLRYYSAGMIFREIARSRGLSLEELSIIAANDPSIDIEIDKRTYEEALKGNVVLDGHLTAWIVSGIADIKIYVTAPLHIRIKRIAGRDNIDLDKAMHETIIREYVQKKRFIEYYGIDIDDLSIFDLVINTEKLSVEETFNIIRGFIEKFLKE